ncbi:MAG: hypothetical protein ACRDCG_01480 [Mycoplasmoidaceae bacterium]
MIKNKQNNFQKKLNLRSIKIKKIFKFITFIFLFILGFSAISLGGYSAYNWKGNLDRFGDSYNIEYKVQLSENKTENLNDTNVFGKSLENISETEALDRLKQSSNSLEKYFLNHDTRYQNMQYSLQQPFQNDNPYGIIRVSLLDVKKLNNTSPADPKLKFSPSDASLLFGNYKNNFLEIIPTNPTDNSSYSNFFPEYLNQDGSKSLSPILSSYGLNPKTATIKKGNKKSLNDAGKTDHIVFNLNHNINIKDFSDSYRIRKNNDKDKDIINLRKFYIFNDLNTKIQEMNYSNLLEYWWGKSNKDQFIADTINEYGNNIDINNYPKKLISKSTYELIKNISKDNKKDIDSTLSAYMDTTYNNFRKNFKAISDWTNETFSKIGNLQSPPVLTKKDVVYMASGYYVDDNKKYVQISTKSQNDNSTSVVEYSIFNKDSEKAVEDCIVDNISIDNYSSYFPDSNTLNDKNSDPGNTDSLNFSLPKDDLDKINFGGSKISNLSKTLGNIHKAMGLSLNQINSLGDLSKTSPDFSNTDITQIDNSSANAHYNQGTSIYNSIIIKNKIGGLSALNSMLIVILVTILLVGIIVSLLYRIPGLFAFLSLATTIFSSAGLLSILTINFSFGLFLGLTFVIILSISSIILILERCRKRFLDKKTSFEAGMGALKKTFISIIDLHVSSILIGVGLIFLGTFSVKDFGLTIIVGSLISFISVSVFFISNFYAFISDIKNSNQRLYFWSGLKKLSLSKLLNNPFNKTKPLNGYQKNTYGHSLQKIRIQFNWKIFLIIIISILLFSIVTLGIILGFGFFNSSVFSNGKIIYIHGNDDIGTNVSKFFTTTVVPKEILHNDLLAIFVAICFSGIYGIIRFSFYGGIPILISTLIGTFFGIGFILLLFFYVDIDSLSIFAFIAAISLLMSTGYISVSNSRFSKKKIFNIESIKLFINFNARNLKYYWWAITFIIIAISIFQFAFISPSLYWEIGICLVATLVSIFGSIITIMISYYGLILLRQLYVKNTIHNSITNRSSKYDAIDEELINGINAHD